MMSNNRIIVLIDSVGAVEYHRLAMPFDYLKERMDITFAVQEDEINAVDFSEYDICVISRYLVNMDKLREAKAKGLKIIVDIDDYWNVPKYNPAYKFYKEKYKKSVIESLNLADMVWATTWQLAEKVAEINPNVHILPNYIDTTSPQWNAVAEHPFTIGYVGGFSHLEDLKLLRGQMETICLKYNARFLLCGYKHLDPLYLEFEKAVHDSKDRPDWFWVAEATNVLQYGKYYAHIDLVLAPLAKTNFNRHKSELKIVEAAAYKLPIAVSDVEPYTNHAENEGVTFVKNNNWISAVGEMIESKKLKEQGQKNFEYCKEHHNIDTINQKRMELLKMI
jgi:glycosyltransferase involved in cell wall biosynthesis